VEAQALSPYAVGKKKKTEQEKKTRKEKYPTTGRGKYR